MNVIAARSDAIYFGLQLARIARLTEHSCRVQKMPAAIDLRVKRWKEQKRRAKLAAPGGEQKTHRRRHLTPHTLVPKKRQRPSRAYVRVKGTGSWRPATTKLTEATVRAIWNDFQVHGAYHGAFVEIGRKYGVNSRTVRDIWTGRTWSYLFRDSSGASLSPVAVGQGELFGERGDGAPGE
jgi:hypothetical protein